MAPPTPTRTPGVATPGSVCHADNQWSRTRRTCVNFDLLEYERRQQANSQVVYRSTVYFKLELEISRL